MPAPAGAPTSVDMRIQAGSSLGLGTGCMLVWVPGICLTGPFSQVWSHIKKLMQQPPETSIAWRIPRISSAPFTVTPTASAIFCLAITFFSRRVFFRISDQVLNFASST